MLSMSSISTFFLSLLATTAFAAPADNTLDKRATLSCTTDGGKYRPVTEVQACVDWLLNKGTDDCVVEGESTVFCQNWNTTVTGFNNGKKDTVTSLWYVSFFTHRHGTLGYSLRAAADEFHASRDVANGAQEIIDSCTTSAGYVGGINAAVGNGYMMVSIDRRKT
ncbi:hypothetical protein BDV06DRAFT_217907 [Aspergillus oleicola]